MKLSVNGLWGASTKGQVSLVLQDAAREFAANFATCPSQVIVIPVEREHPIAYFGEPVIGLTARDCYWAKYIYQFSHELCHILTNHNRLKRTPSGHFQVDEIVCETASLFTLMKLSEAWKSSAPLNLEWFAPSLLSYVIEVASKHATRPSGLIYEDPIHKATERDKNGYMAVKLLLLLWRKPTYWQATQYYPPPTPTLSEFFEVWRVTCPDTEAVDAIIGVLSSEA